MNRYLPLNGDSDLDDVRVPVTDAAAALHRPDWLYLATGGREGSVPQSLPTTFFSWGGQMVMRNGWPQTQAVLNASTDAVWAWFNVGPFGCCGTWGHAHEDKLSLTLRAYGQHFLVDSGRFEYSGDIARWRTEYAELARAHNTATLDGAHQSHSPSVATFPTPASSWSVRPEGDLVCGNTSFEGLIGVGLHSRGVAHLRGKAFVVVDRFVTDRLRTAQIFWCEAMALSSC